MAAHRWHPQCSRPEGVVRPAPLDPTGRDGPTRGQARGSRWRRTSRGWYVPADVPDCVEQRILEQAVRLPSCGAITAWASLRWRGATFFDGRGRDGRDLPVPLVLGGWADLGRDELIVVSRERFWPSQIEEVAGVPCACAERSVFDEMRLVGGRRSGVVVTEMAIAARLTTLDRMWAYVSGCNGWTGVPMVRKSLLLVSEDSKSPPETLMRLNWELDAGFPRPLCNKPVFDLAGNLLGYPDLFDPVAGVVGEYDGALHLEGSQRARDVRREAMFRAHGLEYVTMLAGDLAHLDAFLDRLTAAHRRARRVAETRRSWTVEPPPWWQPSDSVEARRNLTGRARERVMRLRRRAS